MLSCPSCHAGALRRSRARNRREAAIMQLTPFRYFRCHDCSTRVLRLKPSGGKSASSHPFARRGMIRVLRVVLIIALVIAAFYFIVSPYLDLGTPVSPHHR